MHSDPNQSFFTIRVISLHILCLVAWLLLINHPATAQRDYAWWNEKHQWDGHTHWSRYMRISPGYMGPNALPVPRVLDGRISDKHEAELGFSGFSIPGELTLSSFGNLKYSIGRGLALVEVNHIFIEYYKTDTLLRDERFVRSYDVEGFAVGDLSVSTIITLVKNRKWPDMLLRASFRTTSGSKLSDARYTDAPGHYFDVSFGQNLLDDAERNYTLRLFWSAGIYIWQISYTDNRQNDALLAGAGLAWTKGKHHISTETAGYFGYRNERDRPIVLRLMYQYQFDKLAIRAWYQRGLHDVYHHNLNFSLVYSW
jgi:hypothetical protein